MTTLAALVGIDLPGPDAGTCYICGETTDTGHHKPPSDGFTAWATCVAGDVVCGGCWALLHDPRLRRYSWCASREGLQLVTKETRPEMYALLVSPPEPPFAWYLTQGGQKQSWLELTRRISDSRERFWVATDWAVRPVLVTTARLSELSPLLLRMRDRKVSKTALQTGGYRMSHYKSAAEGGWEDNLAACRVLVGDPTWEVMICACV